MKIRKFQKGIVFLASLSLIFGQAFALEGPAKDGANDNARKELLMFFAGEWVSRGIYTATKLEIADLLSTPKSVEELSTLTGTNPDALYRLLHMLSGFHIFEEISEGVFANTEMSRLLAKSNPDSLHALSLFYGEEIHESFDGLFSSVQKGVPAFEIAFQRPVFVYFKENPGRAILFQEAMKEKTLAVAKSSISSFDFKPYKSVFDIGGGYGQFMTVMLKAHPHLSGLVFEIPDVVEKAEKNPSIDKERLAFVSGDFFKSVPKGGDLYILKSVLHDWDDSRAREILEKCHQAMEDNSRLLVIEVVLQPGSLSQYANCMDLLMLSVTGGKERSLNQFSKLFDKSGFKIEKIYPTETEFSIIELSKKD